MVGGEPAPESSAASDIEAAIAIQQSQALLLRHDAAKPEVAVEVVAHTNDILISFEFQDEHSALSIQPRNMIAKIFPDSRESLVTSHESDENADSSTPPLRPGTPGMHGVAQDDTRWETDDSSSMKH